MFLKLKTLPLFLASIVLLSSCKDDAPKPDPAPVTHAPISVQVSENGGPSYTMTDAYVVSAIYDSRISTLSITGKLKSGKSLLIAFNRTPTSSTGPYTTNEATASLDGVESPFATGMSVFNVQTSKIDGNFSTSFPSTGIVTGSFVGITLQ
jgi:hypothetical protein